MAFADDHREAISTYDDTNNRWWLNDGSGNVGLVQSVQDNNRNINIFFIITTCSCITLKWNQDKPTLKRE